MPGAEELSRLEIEPSKVQAQLQHAVAAKRRGVVGGAENKKRVYRKVGTCSCVGPACGQKQKSNPDSAFVINSMNSR